MKFLLLLPLILALFFFAIPSSDAHQDGCHRWHSCPSDSGSYVCGDLGYDNECPVKSDIQTILPQIIDYKLSVETDKNSYSEGEKILVYINTENINSAVSIIVNNVDGDFIKMSQGQLEPRKTLTNQFIAGGSLMTEPGIYTVTVVTVNEITDMTSFEYEPSLKVQIENQISLEKITCFNDLKLMLKNNGDLVCVTHSTLEKLLERNWGHYPLVN